jgi:hypothetical protein
VTSISTGDTSETAFPFIQCLETAEGDPSFAEPCYSKTLGASSSVPWSVVEQCSSEEAKLVQDESASATPTHSYVPWVIVDGTQLADTDALLAAICLSYTGPTPSSCKTVAKGNSPSLPVCPNNN